jgi:tetratricopeptide (TPR) repeat protein
MRLRRSLAFGIVTAGLAGLSPAFAGTAPPPVEPREGLVVLEAVLEAPTPGSPAEEGIQPGDVLLAWIRGDASGVLRWPSGLVEVETEQAPRGTVVLRGRRGDRPRTWRMPADRWVLRTRPALSPHLLALYKEGAEKLATRDPERGAESWRAAVGEALRAEDKPRAAWFLGEIGRAWSKAWRWPEADAAYERAVRQAQGSGLAAPLLREWGATYVQRREWERAESCYRQALALAAPGSFTAARDLAELASLATRRGDLQAAEFLYRQALSARSELTVFGPYLVEVIREEVDGFGVWEGRIATGEEIAEIRRKLQRLRETLLAVAGVPPRPERAEKTAAVAPQKPEPNPLETLQKALAKAEREGPGSLAVSDRWQELGAFAFAEGDLIASEISWLRALDLREKLAPGTLREARTLHDLARVHEKASRNRAAASFFCRAAAALDRMGRTPADDAATRDALGARPAAYDQDCVAALVEIRRPEEAFLALERSRVRGADLPLSAELVRRRKEIGAERVQALARLGQLSTSRDRDEVDVLVGYAEELELRRDEIAGALDLDGLRAALAPGALLLAWSIGDDGSFLFLVRPAESPGPGVEVLPIRLRAASLRERIPAFATEVGPAREEAMDLYRRLFGPADEQIAAAERLVLLPDGVLEPLPFGALLRGESLLSEQKPLETISSATVWAARRAVAAAASP